MANIKKELVAYGLGSMMIKGISFLLIPLYASQFTPRDFGILTFCQIFATVLSWFLGLHIFTGMWRYYYELDKDEQISLVKTSFGFTILFNLLLIIIVLVVVNFFPDIKQNYFDLLLLVTIATISADLAARSASIFRLKRQPLKFLFFSISQTIVQLSMIILFVLVLRKGISSVFWGRMIAGIFIVTLFILVGNRKYFSFNIDKKLTKKMLKFSVPLIPGAIAMWVLNSTDNFFLKYYHSLSDVGIYSFSYKIAMLVQIVLIAPIKQAWNPYIFSNIRNLPLVRKRIDQALLLYFIIGIGMVLGLSFFTKDILRLFAKKEYLEGTKIIFIVGYSYLVFGACALMAIAYHIAEKTKKLPKYFAIAAVCNIILNFFVIPKYGYVGAAYTTIVSFLIIFLLYALNVNKYFLLPINWYKIILMNMLGVSLYIISILANDSIMIKFILILIYTIIGLMSMKKMGLNIFDFSKSKN